MSNTGNLQERIKGYYRKYNVQEIAFQHDGGKGLQALIDIVQNVPYLINQLEQAQEELKQVDECFQEVRDGAALIKADSDIKVNLLASAESYIKQLEHDKRKLHAVHDENYQRAISYQAENEQLKADNNKLVEALKCIREDSKKDGTHYKLDRCYATSYHTLREMGEVDGKDG